MQTTVEKFKKQTNKNNNNNLCLTARVANLKQWCNDPDIFWHTVTCRSVNRKLMICILL